MEDALAEGKTVFQELDVHGAENIRKRLSNETVKSIFITVHSVEDLEGRIRDRQPDISDEDLAVRKERYMQELQFKDKADYVIVNEYGALQNTEQEFSRILGEILQ